MCVAVTEDIFTLQTFSFCLQVNEPVASYSIRVNETFFPQFLNVTKCTQQIINIHKYELLKDLYQTSRFEFYVVLYL